MVILLVTFSVMNSTTKYKDYEWILKIQLRLTRMGYNSDKNEHGIIAQIKFHS